MASRVIGAYENSTRVEIPLAYDKNGDPAFEPDGKPVKGVEPIVLALPRYTFMPRAKLKLIVAAAAEIDARELSDDYTVFDRQRDSILSSVQPFVDDDVYTILEGMSIGELVQINEKWSGESSEPLGESSASAGSSTSTRRR